MTISLAPIRDTWRNFIEALVGEGAGFQKMLTTITESLGLGLGAVIKSVVGVLFILMGVLVSIIEAFVGIGILIKDIVTFNWEGVKNPRGARAGAVLVEGGWAMYGDDARKRLEEAGPSLQSQLGPNAIGQPKELQTPVWVEVEMKGDADEWLTATQQRASRTGRATVLPAQGAP